MGCLRRLKEEAHWFCPMDGSWCWRSQHASFTAYFGGMVVVVDNRQRRYSSDHRVPLGSTHHTELVRNSQGGHVTPTSITFGSIHDPQLIGEDAQDPNVADMNTVGMLDRLLANS